MKPLNYIIFTVIVIALIGVSYSLGSTNKTVEVEKQGNLEITENNYNFGTVGLDKVSHTYMVKNTGDGPLVIKKVSTSCGCTTATLQKTGERTEQFGMDHGNIPYINFVLEPGEEASVVATYNPLAHGMARAAGTFNRVVYIKTENPRDEYELNFKVTVNPSLSQSTIQDLNKNK